MIKGWNHDSHNYEIKGHDDGIESGNYNIKGKIMRLKSQFRDFKVKIELRHLWTEGTE